MDSMANEEDNVRRKIEQLTSFSQQEASTALFSIKKECQESSRFVSIFSECGGLEVLVKVGKGASDYMLVNVLRIFREIIVYVEGIKAIQHSPSTLRWLCSLIIVEAKIVFKTSLKLLLIFSEFSESNLLILIKSFASYSDKENVFLINKMIEVCVKLSDREASVLSTHLAHKIVSKCVETNLEKKQDPTLGALSSKTCRTFLSESERSLGKYLNAIALRSSLGKLKRSDNKNGDVIQNILALEEILDPAYTSQREYFGFFEDLEITEEMDASSKSQRRVSWRDKFKTGDLTTVKKPSLSESDFPSSHNSIIHRHTSPDVSKELNRGVRAISPALLSSQSSISTGHSENCVRICDGAGSNHCKSARNSLQNYHTDPKKFLLGGLQLGSSHFSVKSKLVKFEGLDSSQHKSINHASTDKISSGIASKHSSSLHSFNPTPPTSSQYASHTKNTSTEAFMTNGINSYHTSEISNPVGPNKLLNSKQYFNHPSNILPRKKVQTDEKYPSSSPSLSLSSLSSSSLLSQNRRSSPLISSKIEENANLLSNREAKSQEEHNSLKSSLKFLPSCVPPLTTPTTISTASAILQIKTPSNGAPSLHFSSPSASASSLRQTQASPLRYSLERFDEEETVGDKEWNALYKSLRKPLIIADIDFTDLDTNDDYDVSKEKTISSTDTTTSFTSPPPMPPPPIPSGVMMSNNNNNNISSKKPTIKLFWKEVKLSNPQHPSSKEASCIWEKILSIKFDQERIQCRFESKNKNTKLRDRRLEDNKKFFSILDAKRSNAINIAMAKLPFFTYLKPAILKMDDSLLNKESIERLLNVMLPTEEEIQVLSEAKTSNPGVILASAEDFLFKISLIPAVKERLEIWYFKLEFESTEKELAETLHDFKTALDEIFHSKTFLYVLSAILEIGNYLNDSQIRAFDVDYLLKLNDIKDNIQKNSLLYYVCEAVMLNFPDSTDLYSDFHSLIRSSKLDSKDLQQNLVKLEISCKKFWNNLEIVNKHESSPVFKIRMVDFISKATQSIIIIKIIHRRIVNRFRKSLLFFGIPKFRIASQEMTDFFKQIADFSLQYKNCREKIVEEIKLRKQKEKLKRQERKKFDRSFSLQVLNDCDSLSLSSKNIHEAALKEGDGKCPLVNAKQCPPSNYTSLQKQMHLNSQNVPPILISGKIRKERKRYGSNNSLLSIKSELDVASGKNSFKRQDELLDFLLKTSSYSGKRNSSNFCMSQKQEENPRLRRHDL